MTELINILDECRSNDNPTGGIRIQTSLKEQRHTQEEEEEDVTSLTQSVKHPGVSLRLSQDWNHHLTNKNTNQLTGTNKSNQF